MPVEHSFSDAALTLLDSMWALDMHMAVMRRRLHSLTGIYFTAEEVRNAATRCREKPKRHVADPAIDVPIVPAVRIAMAPRAVPDKERLVAPGSFPVARFSMLGGRVR